MNRSKCRFDSDYTTLRVFIMRAWYNGCASGFHPLDPSSILGARSKDYHVREKKLEICTIPTMEVSLLLLER